MQGGEEMDDLREPPLRTPRLPPAAPRARVAAATVRVYASPMVGLGFLFFLTSVYHLKFATDVLGISPAAMGTILLVSRVWDAVCDPITGFLSDRTRSRYGRRRPWLIASAIPVAATFALLWAPPAQLDATQLALWTGVAYVLFFSATTAFGMPYDSLGAELSDDYHDRNRLFGARRFAFGLGAIAVFAALDAIVKAPDARAMAAAIALPAAAVTALSMILAGLRLRERPEYQGRGGGTPWSAARDVIRNPYARNLLGVFFLQQLGVATITVMAPYFTEYVLGSAAAVTPILGTYFLVSIASIPLWIRLGRRFEKHTLCLSTMVVVGVVMFAFLFVGEGMVPAAVALVAVAGAAGGCLDVILPSIQADVIDTDELRTGERKEGIYFAAWHFVAKTAIGISGMCVGLVLSASGFRPNEAQSPEALFSLRLLMGAAPLAFYAAGTLVFLRFSLTRAVHAEVRASLDRRRAGAATD